MIIKVLGSGCANCNKLQGIAEKVVEDLSLDAQIEKVTDMGEIMGYGVMSTPALVVDEQVRIAGRVPTYGEVVTILTRTA